MNVFNIERSFKLKPQKGWDTLYVVCDAHGTVFLPFHDRVEIYPDAVEVLQWFTKRQDFKLILWTSSWTSEIVEMIDVTKKKYGVVFDHINCNPSERNTDRACFYQKFYFNILLEDKAGFEPDKDWKLVKEELIRIGEWDKV